MKWLVKCASVQSASPNRGSVIYEALISHHTTAIGLQNSTDGNWGAHRIHGISPEIWCSRSATVCFIWARITVFQHKTFVLMLSAWCVFRVWLLCIPFKIILGSCVFTLSLLCYGFHGKIKWFQISASWTRTFPKHRLAPMCLEILPRVGFIDCLESASGKPANVVVVPPTSKNPFY